MIGKIGTDIEDNKCSWLVVQALQKTQDNPEQRKILMVCMHYTTLYVWSQHQKKLINSKEPFFVIFKVYEIDQSFYMKFIKRACCELYIFHMKWPQVKDFVNHKTILNWSLRPVKLTIVQQKMHGWHEHHHNITYLFSPKCYVTCGHTIFMTRCNATE